MLGAYACSTITVICSTFKRVLCHQLELMQSVLSSRDHGLETRVHSSLFCPGLGLGLET